MYFRFFKLHGWGKRFAAQPQTIYSEFPKYSESYYAGKSSEMQEGAEKNLSFLMRSVDRSIISM